MGTTTVQAVNYSPLPDAAPQTMIDPRSMTYHVIYAWWHMRRSVRRLITLRPTETDLLFMVLMSNLFFFASWALRAVYVPRPESLDMLSVEIGVLFFAVMVGRTAFMYFMAMFLGTVMRLLGGRGTWRNTRIAVFWADAVTAPFGVLAALFTVAFSNLEVYYPIFGANWIALPPYWFGLIPVVWYTSVALAQAHGFSKTAPVFLYMSLGSLVAMLIAMYLRANGAF